MNKPAGVARHHLRAARAGRTRPLERFAILGLAGFLGVASPALTPLTPLHAQEVSSAVRPSFVDVAWPGAAMGAGGFLVGGLLGSAFSGCSSDLYCALEGAFYGAGVLGSIGLATGVHLGNDRRGSYALDLVTAGGMWGLAIGVLAANEWPDTATTVAFVTLPIAQMIATVAVERVTGDRATEDRRSRDLNIGLAPGADGGVVVAGRLRF